MDLFDVIEAEARPEIVAQCVSLMAQLDFFA